MSGVIRPEGKGVPISANLVAAPSPGFSSVGWSVIVRALVLPLTAASTLASTALTIRYAGGTAFGAIAVVSTLSQLLPYADLGIGAGVMNAMSTTATGDNQRFSAIASALRWLLFPMLGLTVLAILGTSVFSWARVLGISSSNFGGLDWATAVVLICFAVGVPLGVGQRVLIGLSLNPLAVALGAVVPIITLGLTLLIVLTHAPVAMLAVAPAIGALVSASIFALVGLRKAKFRLIYIFEPEKYKMTGLIGQGLSYLVLTASLALTFQFGRVLLAQRTGLHEVASYSLVMQLYLPIWSFFSVGGIALWPIFARIRARTGTKQAPVVARMALFFALAAVAAGLGLVIFGGWVGGLLSGGQIKLSWWLLVFCALLLLTQAFQFVYGMALTSPADLRFQALCAIPMSIIVVTLIGLTAPMLGDVTPFVWASVGVFCFQICPNIIRVKRNDEKRGAVTVGSWNFRR